MTAVETTQWAPPGPRTPPPGYLPPPPPRRRPVPAPAVFGVSTFIFRSMVTLALLAIWSLFFVFGLSALSASRSQQVLYGELRNKLALATVPIGGDIKPGTPIALLEVPQAGLRYVVVEGTAGADLEAGPGHRRDTPLPGQAGTSLIYGRSESYGGPFRHITDLHTGQVIRVTTGQGTFTYVVDQVRRAGDPVPAEMPSDASRLRLVTAEGVSWRSGWSPDRVVYVDAIMAGSTVPTPAGRPNSTPESDKQMHGDVGEMVFVMLWLHALLWCAVFAAWARVRWGGAQTWFVMAPVLLAVLWGLSNSAVALLPNLM